MQQFLRITKGLIFFIVVFIAHIVAANILPYPANHINIILITLFLLAIYSQITYLVWYSLPLMFFSELFCSTPFGVSTISLLVSLAILNWILLNVLTTRTILIVAISSIIILMAYRVIFMILLTIVNMMRDLGGVSISKAILAEFGIEMIVNTATALVIYLIISLFSKRKRSIVLSDKSYG